MDKSLAVVIAAGGASTRFGSFKPLAALNGKPLISYALDFARCVSKNVYVLLNNPSQAAKLHFFLDTKKVTVILDGSKSKPLACSIAKSMLQVKEGFIFLMGCDTPLLDIRLPQLLLSRLNHSNAAVPVWPNGYIEPMAAIYARHAITNCKEAETMRRLCELMGARYVALREIGIDQTSFININRLDDLMAIAAKLRAQSSQPQQNLCGT